MSEPAHIKLEPGERLYYDGVYTWLLHPDGSAEVVEPADPKPAIDIEITEIDWEKKTITFGPKAKADDPA